MTSWLVMILALLLTAPPAAAQGADPALRAKAAAAAMGAGRFEEAARIYGELAAAMPDDAGLQMNLGMALAMGGREADAIAPLERALALNPKLAPAHLFLGSSYLAQGQPARAVGPLEKAAAARPGDVETRRMLAEAYTASGRTADAVAELRRVTEIAPRLPAGWYALGHAYNALTQDTMSTFADDPGEEPWRQLLLADALFADGRLTDAFTLYRQTLERLPSMVTVHDAIARIYEQTGHKDWAATERAAGALPPEACLKRKALCEFRAGRHRAALTAAMRGTDPESRYFRVRAATELSLAAFRQLDKLPDSRERREVRATLARGQRRYTEAIAELKAALKFAPGDVGLLDDLGTSYYLARDYEQAIATLGPLVRRAGTAPDAARLLTVYGDSLLQLQRVDEAIPVLRRAVEINPADPNARRSLGRASVQVGAFGDAIKLLEPELGADPDGSVHVQLARAYAGVGEQEKATALMERSQQLQQAAQERAAATGQRTITPPK